MNLNISLELEAASKTHKDLKQHLSEWIKRFTATNGRPPEEEKDKLDPAMTNKFAEYTKVGTKNNDALLFFY